MYWCKEGTRNAKADIAESNPSALLPLLTRHGREVVHRYRSSILSKKVERVFKFYFSCLSCRPPVLQVTTDDIAPIANPLRLLEGLRGRLASFACLVLPRHRPASQDPGTHLWSTSPAAEEDLLRSLHTAHVQGVRLSTLPAAPWL